MSIFGDLDVESAADDPFALDDGTYKGVVEKCEVKDSKDGSKKGLFITYMVDDADSKMNGRRATEWKTIPQSKDEEDADRAASFLKQRLLSFGIPADRINSFTPEDAIGVDVVFSVKKNGEYTNVTRVARPDTGGGSTSSAGNAFAGL